ncbi:MAG: hypothetical protein Q9170_008017, partial [Blastenia crenularia]
MASNDHASASQRRILRDIAELQNNPYPNITFHWHDSLHDACLVLTPEDSEPLHLTVQFQDYPFTAPRVTIQSKITHPNVFGNYICASILNTTEGYTPAYTLKSISIQILSFFSSDSLEQVDGGRSFDLREYREIQRQTRRHIAGHGHSCAQCGFDDTKPPYEQSRPLADYVVSSSSRQRRGRATSTRGDISDMFRESIDDEHLNQKSEGLPAVTSEGDGMEIDLQADSKPLSTHTQPINLRPKLLTLPDELLLIILSDFSTKDFWAVTKAIPSLQGIINSYDFIRIQELQCFCLKESFQDTKLGVGVHISVTGRQKNLESEFDLLSEQAFERHQIRRSIQGLTFEHWLPLPLSRRHWRTVRPNIDLRLHALGKSATLDDCSALSVISHFMNDVVVKFSHEAEKSSNQDPRSTLTHASEKAVESYFALFHLLLCLATEQPGMIACANRKIARFLSGQTFKASCPNLGHLLVAALISDQGLTEDITVAIIKEAILRNVVWMLDPKGAGIAELSYLEPSSISEYRLGKTFQASRTSYRLLMFLSLFYRSARTPGKSLETIRDDMFDTHGAPPRGLASQMASDIRRIKEINHFPPFLQEMGLKTMPHKSEFSGFLKRMVTKSVMVGYSGEPITQGQALGIRKMVEPGIEVTR